MSTADATNYYPITTPETQPDDLIVMRCDLCDGQIVITDLDAHAKNRHKSSILRTFISERAYKTWKKAQA